MKGLIMPRFGMALALALLPCAAFGQLGPAPYSPSSPGIDASANAATPLANLSTFTVANPGQYRVQNQSAATIQVQMCASGGTGCSIFLLAPGGGANAQGADTSPEIPWFTGLVNILGTAGSQFGARHN